MKALEKTQLNNWKEYLEFEIENGTPERVVVLFERCLIACALYEEFWTKVMWPLTLLSLPLLPALPHPRWYHIDTVNRPALSLRVTLICDCICCIRGWPACHTRFDCSICQLLRCIFFVSHYLTETYLIGSMKVLMGLHRKFLKTILSMKKFTVSANWNFRFKMCCLFFFCLSPSLLFFFSVLFCISSNSLSLFHSEVCKISRGLQHRRREAYLQEGVYRPSAQETSHPPVVGCLWGTARWVTARHANWAQLNFHGVWGGSIYGCE